MARNTEFLQKLGIEYPIIQAPMAGGFTTDALVAAVSNAGGLGSLGAAYLKPAEIVAAVERIRALTDKPFNVNLFAGGYGTLADCGESFNPQPMLDALAEIYAELGLPAPTVPEAKSCPFPEQLEAILETRPSVFSFTFGIPDSEAIARLKAHGIVTVGTATTVEEGRLLTDAGMDAIVAQGSEAGAHRGTFAAPFDASMVPTLQLVRGIADISPVPVIASGGIMDGRDIALALAAGASAVQLGTAFLACPESGASVTHKQSILAAREDTTTVTRAFSGRPARGLLNEFISRLKDKEQSILPFPQQNALTRLMRTAAAKRGDSRFLSLWAGTGVARARSLPAAELVNRLMREMKDFGSANRG